MREIDDNLLNYYQRPSRRDKGRGDPKTTHGNMSYIKEDSSQLSCGKVNITVATSSFALMLNS